MCIEWKIHSSGHLRCALFKNFLFGMSVINGVAISIVAKCRLLFCSYACKLDGSVYSLLLLPVLLVAPDSINPFSELFEFVDVRLDQEHTVMCTKLKIC